MKSELCIPDLRRNSVIPNNFAYEIFYESIVKLGHNAQIFLIRNDHFATQIMENFSVPGVNFIHALRAAFLHAQITKA